MTATAVILSPGEALGGFRIADVIGIGGMGIVYRAQQISLDREVALKVLSPQLSGDETFSERFRSEGMHAARLDHPNVIPVYDAGEDRGRLYLAMRLVEGMSLAERLRVKPLTAREALDILGPIAGGLDEAHAAGLVHRDVKPQNILLTDGGHPYLADFGLAKGVESAGLTASGGFVGTLNYAAPEQILGSATSPATDVYALAAVLYHCLTGMVPFPRDTQAGLMFAQVNQAPPRIPLAEADEFNQLTAKGMAKDPEDRFPSAVELMAAAEHAVEQLPAHYAAQRPAFATDSASPTWPTGAQPVAAVSRPRPRRSITRPLIASVAALVVAAGAIAATTLGGRAAAAPKRTAQSPPLAIPYSAPWKRTRGALGVFALSRRSRIGPDPPIELGYSFPGGSASLAAGWLARSAAIPGGPPPALVSRFHAPSAGQSLSPPGSSTAIYHWSLSDVWSLTAWVIPTVRGDLAIICSAPLGMAQPMRLCDAMAQQVRITGVARLGVGADTSLASSLAAILSHAAAPRDALAATFSNAASGNPSVPKRQAGVDAAAQRSLAKLQVPARYQGLVTGLAAELGAEAGALRALSGAVAAGNRSHYARDAGAVKTESGEVARLTSALRRDELLLTRLSPLVAPAMPVIPPVISSGGTGGSTSTSVVSVPSGVRVVPEPSKPAPPSLTYKNVPIN